MASMTPNRKAAAYAMLALSTDPPSPTARKRKRSSPTPAPISQSTTPEPEQPEVEDEGIIRCICDFDHDDGYTIACDKCSSWQHGACFGIQAGKDPPEWYCERCVPREVDKEKARRIQIKKQRANAEMEAAGPGRRRRPSDGIGRKGTRITAAGASSKKLRDSHLLEDDKQEETRMVEPWKAEYVPLSRNQVSEDAKHRLRQYAIRNRDLPLNLDPSSSQPLRHPTHLPNPTFRTEIKDSFVGGVSTTHYDQPPTYSLLTTTPIPESTLISQYTCNVVPAEAYLSNPVNQYSHLGVPKPHVRLLGKPLDLALDARLAGNEARFMRSGCHPNAVLRPVICGPQSRPAAANGQSRSSSRSEDGTVSPPPTSPPTPEIIFGVFATRDLKAKEEVILGWEWDDGHVVHELPALIQAEAMAAEDDGNDMTTPYPHPAALSRAQQRMSQVLNSLAKTFMTCACGSKAKDCAVTQMNRFVNMGKENSKANSGGYSGLRTPIPTPDPNQFKHQPSGPENIHPRSRPRSSTTSSHDVMLDRTPTPSFYSRSQSQPLVDVSVPYSDRNPYSPAPLDSGSPAAPTYPLPRHPPPSPYSWHSPNGSYSIIGPSHSSNSGQQTSGEILRPGAGPSLRTTSNKARAVDLGPLVGVERGVFTRNVGTAGMKGVELVDPSHPNLPTDRRSFSSQVDFTVSSSRPHHHHHSYVDPIMVPLQPPLMAKKDLFNGKGKERVLEPYAGGSSPTAPFNPMSINGHAYSINGHKIDKGKGRAYPSTLSLSSSEHRYYPLSIKDHTTSLSPYPSSKPQAIPIDKIASTSTSVYRSTSGSEPSSEDGGGATSWKMERKRKRLPGSSGSISPPSMNCNSTPVVSANWEGNLQTLSVSPTPTPTPAAPLPDTSFRIGGGRSILGGGGVSGPLPPLYSTQTWGALSFSPSPSPSTLPGSSMTRDLLKGVPDDGNQLSDRALGASPSIEEHPASTSIHTTPLPPRSRKRWKGLGSATPVAVGRGEPELGVGSVATKSVSPEGRVEPLPETTEGDDTIMDIDHDVVPSQDSTRMPPPPFPAANDSTTILSIFSDHLSTPPPQHSSATLNFRRGLSVPMTLLGTGPQGLEPSMSMPLEGVPISPSVMMGSLSLRSPASGSSGHHSIGSPISSFPLYVSEHGSKDAIPLLPDVQMEDAAKPLNHPMSPTPPRPNPIAELNPIERQEAPEIAESSCPPIPAPEPASEPVPVPAPVPPVRKMTFKDWSARRKATLVGNSGNIMSSSSPPAAAATDGRKQCVTVEEETNDVKMAEKIGTAPHMPSTVLPANSPGNPGSTATRQSLAEPVCASSPMEVEEVDDSTSHMLEMSPPPTHAEGIKVEHQSPAPEAPDNSSPNTRPFLEHSPHVDHAAQPLTSCDILVQEGFPHQQPLEQPLFPAGQPSSFSRGNSPSRSVSPEQAISVRPGSQQLPQPPPAGEDGEIISNANSPSPPRNISTTPVPVGTTPTKRTSVSFSRPPSVTPSSSSRPQTPLEITNHSESGKVSRDDYNNFHSVPPTQPRSFSISNTPSAPNSAPGSPHPVHPHSQAYRRPNNPPLPPRHPPPLSGRPVPSGPRALRGTQSSGPPRGPSSFARNGPLPRGPSVDRDRERDRFDRERDWERERDARERDRERDRGRWTMSRGSRGWR